jgi:pyridoxamine 5'-phosphate oxidase
MSLAPWRSLLSRALHKNRSLPYARYFQLATVRADSRPANRTVVFRGFLEDTDQLKIITDSRSQKADQIDHHPGEKLAGTFPTLANNFVLPVN